MAEFKSMQQQSAKLWTNSKGFVKRRMVLSISALLALVSCFIVPPSRKYLDYIDYRTIALLFCFMAVIAGLQRLGVFDQLSHFLVSRARTEKQIAVTLVVMCYVFAMFLTNDITLITVVPLTIVIFTTRGPLDAKQKKLLVLTLVMESLAANFGGMAMPFGSPQNMYLYSFYNMHLMHFFAVMLPYSIIGILVMIVLVQFIRYDKTTEIVEHKCLTPITAESHGKVRFALFLVLFALSILSVARVIDYRIVFAIVLVATFFLDRTAIRRVNYPLLLTFIFFFIFVGNIGSLEVFRTFLEHIVGGNAMLTAILTSQVTSNVPAAILLSKFTHDGAAILIGTNVGGMGTLIASMASLITYQLLIAKFPDTKGMFLRYFTLYNVALLVPFYGLYMLLHSVLHLM